MLLFVILFVATLMAIFGMIGFLRGARGSLIILIAMVAGIFFLRLLGAQVVGYINKAWGLMQGSDSATLINPQDRAVFYLMLFYVALLAGVGLGSLRPFRAQGKFSFSGLLLGLINGYVVATYTLAVLLPQYAFLPVLIPVSGMTPTTPASVPSTSSFEQLGNEFLKFLNGLATNRSVPIIIAGLIVVFIVLASRLSGKKG